MNKKFWATTFTLTGTVIGAGILGLPYVFSKSGFLIGLFWIILLGVIITLVSLWMGEVTLRTKEKHQLAGYAKKYLGKNAGRLMFIAAAFGVYSALLAYLIGEGESFSYIFTGSLSYSIGFGIAFWVIMTFLLQGGLGELKRVESWGVMAIIGLIVAIVIYFSPKISPSNLIFINGANFFIPLGVVLFALLGFTCIPELKQEIRGQEKNLKKAILVGMLIPIVVYILFSMTFVGVLGSAVEQVATISLGHLVTLLGIFTMLTSYFVLSYVLKDMLYLDSKNSIGVRFFLVSILPIVLYLVVSFFHLAGFVKVLGIGGVISGGTTGILILLTTIKAKRRGDRKPEFSLPLNWLTIIILSAIFIFGVVIELFL